MSAFGVAAVVAVAAMDSVAGAALTAGLLAAVGLCSTGVSRWAARRGETVSVGYQIAVGVVIPVVLMVLLTTLFALVMFLSTHDAVLIVLVALFGGALGLLSALMATERLRADVRAVRERLDAVSKGRHAEPVQATSTVELVELSDAVNTMTERLANEERLRRHLLAAISHDLRTPITSMRLVTAALEDDLVDESERHQYLGRLGRHLDGMHALIEDLFELSRLEAGEVAWTLEPVDLAMLVGDTVDAMVADARAKNVRVTCEIAHDLVPVQANPAKLQRVLFNLLQNAIRYAPASTVVIVAAERTNGSVEVEVSDEGPGIEVADRARVFESFVQVGDRAARGRGGAGLGLAISRAIISAHGGAIEAVGADRGARIRFSIPAADA